ncbi:hypothetical protein BN1356_02544 [Streptococcus varani]|uniref:Uncharacterized protein n=1 Tax=Streptococcus varani TaxID=1608583 RepID=A0A0E3WFV3_9STRE|nr:hypothetical protein BN1356_02544 [Streptococcus varani]
MTESKVNMTVQISNANEFRSLVSKFNKKARELEELAHELEMFRFHGELETSILSTDADKVE